MKRMVLVLFAMMLIPLLAFAGITKKVVEKHPDISGGEQVLPGAPKTVIYSDTSGKEVAKEIYDDQGNLLETIGAIPDGTVTEYYDNGSPLAVYNYKNGKLEGTSKGYFESGALRGEWNYKNSLLNGIVQEYYENGKVRHKIEYKNNLRDGPCELFLEDGKPAVSWEYKDGMREGLNKVYYPSGTLHFVLPYENNEREGITMEYYESGTLKGEYTYKVISSRTLLLTYGKQERKESKGTIFIK